MRKVRIVKGWDAVYLEASLEAAGPCLVTFFDKVFVPFWDFDDEIFFAIGHALTSQS